MLSCDLPRRRRLGLWPAALALLPMLGLSTPALADLETAERAFYAQDYDAALREAQPLAEQGDEVAQRIVRLSTLMIEVKRLHNEHRAATGPIDLRDYDGRTKTRSVQDQARFDSGRRHYDAKAYEAALREWVPLAEAGDAEAALMLSFVYRQGRGVAQDTDKADSYLFQAAEAGFGPAQSLMPQLFDLVSWVDEAAQREGFHWAMRAAANGEIGAYIALSSAYCHGRGTDKNPVLADIWRYLATPDKELFLDHTCSRDVKWPTSYYEAIAERAAAMQQAYDIPMAPLVKGAEAEGTDGGDAPR